MRRAHRLSCFLTAIAFALGACSAEKAGGGEEAASNAHEATNDSGWLTGGHDAGETYFSPLKQVNASNIDKLGYAWSYDLNSTHGMEATPVVIDGVMYASAPWGYVHALDAKTGAKLWVFDPKVDGSITSKVCCGVVNRGLSVADGRVFVVSIDGRLFALDAKTGEIAWQEDTIIDHARGYTVTGSTYVAGNVVVIGNSGAELDARGYVSAYDIKTGELKWRFFTVPASAEGPFEHPELEAAAKTWDPNSFWEVGLGGTVWDGMAYDPELDLVYVGVGNSALYPRKLRSPAGGDNLYVASILALDRKTGRMAWYYQTTPGDQWDYTATQKMILADIEIGGRERHVIMQAPKNGFFYVIDRETGELLSAEPYVPVNWASHVDLETGRPVELAQADYSDGPRLVFPAPAGGHNWQPMAFNPGTGLVYIPAVHASAVFWIPEEPFIYQKGGANAGAMYAFPAKNAGAWGLESEAAKALPPLSELAKGQPDTTIRGFLRAWDPVANKVAWEIETSDRWVGEMNATWNGGGVMTTAGGLVFQGRSTGYLHVYRADTGEQLAQINVGTAMMAAPMTYELDGEQYVAVMAGFGGALGGSFPEGTAPYRYGNAGRIVAFKLGGGVVPLPTEVEHASAFPRPSIERFGTQAQIDHGNELLKRHCSRCHKNNDASGAIPDLRRMSAETDAAFEDIVLRGARAEKGMGSFEGVLTPEEVEAIHAAIVDAAWREYKRSQPGPQNKPHEPVKQ
ncbi:MAG TPA: PQQ-dependent dehydrogenase, methanol/ethanol family [Parvularculaceae bacterium]|nr:PQQ-dependent dehydrogenase, methanol/ethanol family [Amphiplicatus sp.]HPE31477.1 PQQ-dependent dehydrogenase, methanol/ethanol family [Parvularculaceae bacterium]HRX39162.1 PQQ-dependent dehydrogenase, methanol/ethanol family [Parvularculaceae bacterium]